MNTSKSAGLTQLEATQGVPTWGLALPGASFERPCLASSITASDQALDLMLAEAEANET